MAACAGAYWARSGGGSMNAPGRSMDASWRARPYAYQVTSERPAMERVERATLRPASRSTRSTCARSYRLRSAQGRATPANGAALPLHVERASRRPRPSRRSAGPRAPHGQRYARATRGAHALPVSTKRPRRSFGGGSFKRAHHVCMRARGAALSFGDRSLLGFGLGKFIKRSGFDCGKDGIRHTERIAPTQAESTGRLLEEMASKKPWVTAGAVTLFASRCRMVPAFWAFYGLNRGMSQIVGRVGASWEFSAATLHKRATPRVIGPRRNRKHQQ
jgi:hypothetical protein